MKTALEWLLDQWPILESKIPIRILEEALEMEKQQQKEKMYSEEEVIAIVEKSRETGLTAEYLLLTEQFKKK
jgi:hypothetical protein